jgi:hypothetical protein
MSESAIAVSLPWYRTLNREQWRVLLAANLGWLFDGFEIYALFLTVGFALHQLLDPSEYGQIPRYAGYILATTVFGWATGGVIGGIVADYLGRKRTMMLAVLATLTEAHVPHEGHIYKGANHGFHNDTTPRYDEAAAKEAWQHTLDWFNKYLSA